jgi:hypothetical protein
LADGKVARSAIALYNTPVLLSSMLKQSRYDCVYFEFSLFDIVRLPNRRLL